MPDYNEIMRYLNQLCLEKADGVLFVTTNQNHSVRFELFDGAIISVHYRLKRDHDAIPLIKAIESGKYRFFEGMSKPDDDAISTRSDLFEALFEQPPPSAQEETETSSAADKPSSASVPTDSKTIEAGVAMLAETMARFIGPVARLICDEYIEKNGKPYTKDDLIKMMESLAAEIGDSSQASEFSEKALSEIESMA